MGHDRAKFDVLAKIEKERLRRNWTEYTLAKNSGIAQSTISTWYRKRLQPSISSIEKICNGLGLTLSEFFQDETSGLDARIIPTKELRELGEAWEKLNPSQKKAFLGLMRSYSEDRSAETEETGTEDNK